MIGKPPKVSFVIPAYNAAKTLPATLQSLVAQTCPEWEAIVVDDGSRDRTSAVIAAQAADDRRFTLVRRPNGGASAARNSGLEVARGVHVVFLDADDWIAPRYLETLLPLAADERTIAYCAYRRVFPSGRAGPADWCPDLQTAPFALLARRCDPAIHCVVAPRDLIMDVGGFDPELRTCEDWDLWLRLARTGARFIGTPQPLASYRMRPHSLSTGHCGHSRDAERVMQRALMPDARVRRPASEFASGWASAPEHRLAAALEAEIARLGAGGPPSPLWLEAALGANWADAAAREMEQIACEIDRIGGDAGLCPEVLAKLLAGASSADPWIGAALANTVDRLPLEPASNVPRGARGRWMVTTVDPKALPGRIEPLPGCDALLLRFRIGAGGNQIAMLPMTGLVERSQIAQSLLATHTIADLLRATSAWQSPGFWQGFLTQSLKFLTPGGLRLLTRRHGRRALAGHALRSGLANRLGAGLPLRTPSTIRTGTATILHFGLITKTDCGLLDDCLGLRQLAELLGMIGNEGCSTVPLRDLQDARNNGRRLPINPLALVFSDAASFIDRDVVSLLERTRMCAELLLAPGELLNRESEAEFADLRTRGVRFGLRADRLPHVTADALALVGQCRRRLRDLNGDTGASAMSAGGGLPDAICQAAGFAPIISTGSAQSRLDGWGPGFSAVTCTGSEALGTVIESLRPMR